jgi:predicted Zn-dependent protease
MLSNLARALGLLLLGAGLGACEKPPSMAAPDLADADPLVLERLQTVQTAVRRGETGARLELAKTYDANGLAEAALAAYAACDASDAAPATLAFLRAQVLETLGRSAEALAAYDQALLLGDRYAPTHWHRGELLLEAGRSAESRAAFEAARALEPLSVPAALGLARVHLAEDDPAAARAVLEPLAARANDERFVHGLLARALRALGDERGAQRELEREERAARISLSDPRAAEVRTRTTGRLEILRQAEDALGADDPARALALVSELRQRLPDDLALLQMHAKALLAAKEYAAAAALLEPGIRAHPDQFKLELAFGQALAGQKAHKRALEHLARACELNPAFGPAHAAHGETLLKLGRFAEAEAELARALECGAAELRTHLLLVQALFEQEAFARARTAAEAAHTEFPNAASGWCYLAEARARTGDEQGARAALAEVEQRNPDYERLELVRGLLAGKESR